MSISDFLERVRGLEPISFAETMAVIGEYYDYQACEFSNGKDDELLVNKAGSNEGSCRIFAFAQLHQLNRQETLNLFGDYYRVEVLANADGKDHQNIRNFMKYGWEGIAFKGNALSARTADSNR